MNEKSELQTYEEPTEQISDALQIESMRAMKQVEAQIISAKKFPRDQLSACKRITDTCKRPTFAKQSLYLYPRGGETVTGPSIRMAEMIAQQWGNLDFGITELSQETDASIVQSYCWDMETNVRQTKTFKVPHYRWTRKNGKTKLSDPRDIYELIANNGARRLRACILGVIPQDVIEDAVSQCRSTMNSSEKEIPIKDRIKKMLSVFDAFGITQQMIEEKYDMKAENLRDNELLELITIYNSIKDGQSSKKDWFKISLQTSEQTEDLNSKFAK